MLDYRENDDGTATVIWAEDVPSHVEPKWVDLEVCESAAAAQAFIDNLEMSDAEIKVYYGIK